MFGRHVGCGGRISCLPFPGEASAVVLANELVRVSQLPFCPRCPPSSLLRSLGSQESLELHPTGRELHGPRPHGCWRCVPPSWAVHQRAGAPLPHAAVGARVRGGSRTGPLRAGVLPHVWPQELRGSRRGPVAVWSRLSFLASGSCPSVLMPRDRAGGDVHRRHHLELTRRPAGVRSGTARCRKVPRAWLTRGLCDHTGPQSTPCSLF